MATDDRDSPTEQDYQRHLNQVWCFLFTKDPEDPGLVHRRSPEASTVFSSAPCTFVCFEYFRGNLVTYSSAVGNC